MVGVIYQLTWKILPGLAGLGCSEFRAVPIPLGAEPDNERGVAIECASETECAALVHEFEAHFALQRFSNNASAFETVKSYVIERAGRNTPRGAHGAPSSREDR